jgi:hypothetical protein
MHSLKNYLLILLALVIIGLSALAWRQHQEINALRAASLRSDERADLQKRVWAAQKRATELETRLATSRRDGSDTAADAAQADRSPSPRAAAGRLMSGFASMMDRPDMARLMAIQQKAQIDARFAPLFKKLGLSPDKLAQFKSLLADRLSTPIDVMTAAGQQGINPMQDPQQFRELVQNAQAGIDEKIQSLLDTATYAQYQDYVQTEPQRALVTQLQQSLSYTDAPLSAAQADQLTQILAQTSPARAAGAVAGAVYTRSTGSDGNVVVAVGPPPPDGGLAGGLLGGSTITDAAVAQAQNVLSPAQLQALKEIQQQQQAAARLRQQMFQNAPAGVPPPPPPPG